MNCSGVTNLSIGNSVTEIGARAFYNISLTSIRCDATMPPNIHSNTFSNYNASLKVPESSLNRYQTHQYWKKFSFVLYDFITGGIYYKINGNNTVAVTYINTDYNSYSGDISIPKTVTCDGVTYQVTAIGENAFKNCTDLTSIILPNSVKTIEDYAFSGCSGLAVVTIGNSVKSIGAYAFMECSELTGIVVPNSVSSIGHNAFEGCAGLKSVTLSNTLTTISNSAFSGCRGLKSVTIPNSVTTIEEQAFKYCTKLTGITIGNSVTEIGKNAFYNAPLTSIRCLPTSPPQIYSSTFSYYDANLSVPKTSLTSYQSHQFWSRFTIVIYDFSSNGVYYSLNENYTVTVTYMTTDFNSYSGDVSIPETVTCDGVTYEVTAIDANAFRGSTGLTSVIIPNTVISIGENAFMDCISLTSINLPNSVKTVGSYAFSGCTKLKQVIIEDGNEKLSIDTPSASTPFMSCPIETLYLGRNLSYSGSNSPFKDNTTIEDVTVGNNVTSIGSYAFSGCTGILDIALPNSVSNIGGYAFSGCIGLTRINIPGSVKAIDTHVFSGCIGLTSFIISNEVASIGTYAFEGCKGIESITIGNSVKSIGYGAFSDCTGLTELIIKDGNDTLSMTTSSISSPFKNCPIESLYLGRNLSYGNSDFPFKVMATLTSLTIGNTVTAINEEAFSGCTGLTELIIKDGNEALLMTTSSTSSPFTNCPIETLYLGRNLSCSSSNSPFKGMSTLSSATIGYGATTIGNTFYRCTGLIEITIGKNVTSIGKDAFYGCKGLTSVIIPPKVTSIGTAAFSGCTGLTSVTIGKGVTNISYNAFSNCNELAEIHSQNRIPPVITQLTFEEETEQNATLYVSQESLTVYKQQPYWENFVNIIEEIVIDSGDVNADGEVNVADVNAVIDAIFTNDISIADVNCDGEVNIADINAVISIILGS